MVNRSILINLLPYRGLEQVNITGATNRDIVKEVVNSLQRSVELTAPIAHLFEGKTPKETVYNVYKYLLYNIQYKADGPDQRVRLAPFLVRYFGDCKSYTSMAIGIFYNLKLPSTVRFASYNNSSLNHVYPIAAGYVCDAVYGNILDNKGNVIAKDISKFNQEKPFFFKKDFQVI